MSQSECVCDCGDGRCTCRRCGRTYTAPKHRVRAVCKVQPRPGTELKSLLAFFGITASPTCKCNKMARQMDSWGAEESLKHIEEIVDVMQETAKARKLPFLRAAGRKLVRIACNRARKKSAGNGH